MATTTTKSNTRTDREDLAEQVETLQRDIKNMSKTITRLANGQVENVKEDALKTARQAEDMIRANPLAAVALTLGVGFIFGIMTRR